MLILGFGTYDRTRHPRVGVMLDGLRDHGFDIEECNAPLDVSTAERVKILKQTWRVPLVGVRLLGHWFRLAVLGRRIAHRRKIGAVLVGYLGHFDVLLARMVFPRTPIVLDHLIFAADTARNRGIGAGWRGKLLSAVDGAAIRAASVVVLDTPEHAELLDGRGRMRARAVTVPVGASREWFEAGETAAGREDSGPMSIVFFGLYTPLQGTPVIARALQMLADREVPFRATLIGSGQDYPGVRAELDGLANVTWREWVGWDELPGVVAAHDVCLGIFDTGPKALRVVPNKVYQGAAAGCAIVTSATVPQRRVLGEAGVLVPPGDPEALVDALAALAHDPAELCARRFAATALAARSFTPAAVVAPLAEMLAG